MDAQSLYDFLISKDGFPSKFSYNKGTSNPTEVPSIVPSFFLNTSTESIWVYSGSINGWKEGLGGSGNGGKYIAKSNDFEIEKFAIYVCDVTTKSINATFKTTSPAYEPTFGDWFEVYCPFGDSSTNNITINFMGASFLLESSNTKNFIMDYNTSFRFVYVGGTIGWKPILIELDDIFFDREKYEIKSSNFYVANNTTYFVDTTTTVITATVPTNITYPFKFKIIDMKNNTETRYITINFTTNGYKFEGTSSNDRINSNGSICEYIAIDTVFGFKKIEIKSSKINEFSYAKTYNKGDRCYYCGILSEANDQVAQYTLFTWGTSGATWKPINVNGTWRGIYSSTNAYSVNDLVAGYSGEGTIYKLVGVSSVAIGDTKYDISSGEYRNRWYPISMNTGVWALGSTSTANGRQGLCPPPQKGEQDKFLTGGMIYVSPYITGEIKSVATTNIPTGWLECNGTIVSRTTYSDLFNAITISDSASPTTGSKTVTCSDTSKLCAGMVVEFGTGTWGYTIASIDSATTYSLDVVCTDMTGSQAVRYFPFGNGGNGTRDLFNLPNMMGKTIIGSGQGSTSVNFVSANINISTDIITIPSTKALFTGTEVKVTTNGTIPTGLTSGGTYYIIKVSDTTIKLATSVSNALNGTAIDITGQGSGSHVLKITYTNRGFGEIGGEEKHTQTVSELASHNHSFSNTYSVQYTQDGWGTTQSSCDEIYRTETTSNTGGGQAFNIMNPYVAMRYIIKY